MSANKEPSHSPHEIVSDHSRALYTIEMVESITHLSRDRILVYTRQGLVSPVTTEESASSLAYDEQGIHQLRRLAHLLSQYELNQDGLLMVSGLLNEVERLREEVRFLRGG